MIMSGLSTKKSRKTCCVPQCTVISYKCPTLSFHGFPKNEKMKKLWLVKIRRDQGPLFQVSASKKVCSRHFMPDDFLQCSEDIERRLKPEAFLSLFTWNNFQPPKVRKQPAARCTLTPADINIEQCEGMQDEKEEPEAATTSSPSTEEMLALEQQKNIVLQEKIRELEESVRRMHLEKTARTIEQFGLERYSTNNDMVEFYTGFPNYITLKTFYAFLEPHAKLMYQAYGKSAEKLHRKRTSGNMHLIDELFMFLVRLRLGSLIIDLADRFDISQSSVSMKINNWTNFLYTVLGSMNIWLSRDEINEYMPEDFKVQYPATRVIVDCTELFMQRPSSLVRNSQLYSNYKGHATFKSLIGISPHGSVTFVSKLYSGSMSDSEITQLSGLLDLLEPGDSVMSNKGFTVKNLLLEKGVTLNTPAFLWGKGQFSQDDVHFNQGISSLRVHVERAIRRIKEYRIFHGKMPLTMCGSLNQLWTVAALLTNFKPPFVAKYAPTSSYQLTMQTPTSSSDPTTQMPTSSCDVTMQTPTSAHDL